MKKSRKFLIVFIVLVLLIISYIYSSKLVLWRDDAQQWLLCRELNFFQLLSQLKYEGHPFFWYIFIYLFQILGFSFEQIRILPFIISLLGILIFLFRVELPLYFKIIVSFSASVICYSIVLARSYSLCFLLVILLLVVYKKRKENVLIYNLLLGLLLNTHILMAGFVGSLFLLEIYEYFKSDDLKTKVKVKGGILLFLIFLVFLFYQMCGNNGVVQVENKNFFDTFFLFLSNILAYFYYQSNNIFLTFIMFLLVLVQFLIFIKKRSYKVVFIFSISWLYLLVVHTFIYGLSNYMSCIFYFIFLVCIFIFYLDSGNINTKKLLIIPGTILFIITVFGVFSNYKIIKFDFDNAKVIAKYIENNLDENKNIYCINTPICSTIIPYVENYKFINLNNNKRFTYINWGEKNIYNKYLNEDDYQYLLKNSGYYIHVPMEKKDKYLEILKKKNRLKLVTKSDKYISNGEVYELYLIS